MTARFRVEITCEDALYCDDHGEPNFECARPHIVALLSVMAGRLDRGDHEGRIIDINGNAVGHFAYEDGSDDADPGVLSDKRPG